MSGHTCPCSCLCFCEGVKQRPDLGCARLCQAANPTTHRPSSGTPSAAGSDDERQGFVVTPEESPDE